jgi:primosomal protein N' (replication factor Y)
MMSHSKSKDSAGYLWVEEGEQHVGVVAEVAPVIPVHQTYTFAVPDSLAGALSPGQRVRVPVGRSGRLVPAFVLTLDRRVWDSTLRPIDSLIDEESYLTEDLIELGRRISTYYCCPLGRTLKAITPEAVRRQRGLRTVRYARLMVKADEIRAEGTRMGAKRRTLLEHLKTAGAPVEVKSLLVETGVSSSVLRAVVTKGWVEIATRKELPVEPMFGGPTVEPEFSLNTEQQEALVRISTAIDKGEFSATLLFGVSGSGKTEVYVHAIRRVVAAGKQAILLVPEIVLTTQLVQRLACRFHDVAVVHSGLTGSRRSIIWRQIASGEKKVIIGTRSAVFAPCADLGLICVDEEQETSYKNLQAPRFHVRDVAIMRAHQLGVSVVMGSATPSIETWYNSMHRAGFDRAILHKRVKDLPLPEVAIVDMREEYRRQHRTVLLSDLLINRLRETLDRKEQAVLLMNRRGYASRMYCPSCRSLLHCPNCSVSLVVHATTGESICHHCHAKMPTPTLCPSVGCGAKLIRLGAGTERVEDIVSRMFPGVVIRRVDSDTMRHRVHYQQVVDEFESRAIDVLVGTQMIAKGLDFPHVTFVGVIDADVGASAMDFRAQESLFHLMTQVAGRAGRDDRAGRVVVQTMSPDMPGLRFAVRHDYESFVENELKVRRQAGLPPFRRIARLVLAREREETARCDGQALADRLREIIADQDHEHVEVWGPHPCPLIRLRGQYRYDLLVLAPLPSTIQEILGELRASRELRKEVQSLTIDVDPVSLS